jgi:hypothetical protein
LEDEDTGMGDGLLPVRVDAIPIALNVHLILHGARLIWCCAATSVLSNRRATLGVARPTGWHEADEFVTMEMVRREAPQWVEQAIHFA